LSLDNVPERYRRFRDGEGIPVHTGLAVSDVSGIETGDWERTGQRGAFINLYGSEGVSDLQVHELVPEGVTETQRHFYDEMVYVVEGTGVTIIGEEERTFEWQEHSMFHIPNNTPYRHINTSGDRSVRLLSQTTLPHLLQMIPFENFLFEDEYDFWGEIRDEFYSADGTIREGDSFPVVWEANFIPDIRKFDKLELWERRGAGGSSVRFPMPNSSMWNHISEFPVGTYKKAHRHDPGATVGILSGEGYSLLWREGWDRIAKVDWQPGSLLVPPGRWYHQHFNVGDEPARYFAIHSPRLGTTAETDLFDAHNPENQIEYVNEAPDIRETFEAELATQGRSSEMPAACYTDPHHTFRPAT
jgi:oxalate decarboxylase/phosphoglucose isomerase-like protein (cupin superfamily)